MNEKDLLWTIYQKAPLQAQSSTGTSIFYRGGGKDVLVGTINDPKSVLQNLHGLLEWQPNPIVGQFVRVDNDVEDYLYYARSTVQRVLEAWIPLTLEVRFAVFALGAALEIQMAKHPKVNNPREGIFTLMKKAGVPEESVSKYKRVHCFYLSTKHWNSATHSRSKTILAGPAGKGILARFYDCVAEILHNDYPFLVEIQLFNCGTVVDWNDCSLDCLDGDEPRGHDDEKRIE